MSDMGMGVRVLTDSFAKAVPGTGPGRHACHLMIGSQRFRNASEKATPLRPLGCKFQAGLVWPSTSSKPNVREVATVHASFSARLSMAHS